MTQAHRAPYTPYTFRTPRAARHTLRAMHHPPVDRAHHPTQACPRTCYMHRHRTNRPSWQTFKKWWISLCGITVSSNMPGAPSALLLPAWLPARSPGCSCPVPTTHPSIYSFRPSYLPHSLLPSFIWQRSAHFDGTDAVWTYGLSGTSESSTYSIPFCKILVYEHMQHHTPTPPLSPTRPPNFTSTGTRCRRICQPNSVVSLVWSHTLTFTATDSLVASRPSSAY